VGAPYRAGASVEDFCRVCKELRDHRVIAVDGQGAILRVVCGYCQSDHHFRGGRVPGEHRLASGGGGGGSASVAPTSSHAATEADAEERVLTFEDLDLEGDLSDLEKMLRRVIREESGLTPVTPGEKWRGGELIMKPGKSGLQEKAIPIDTFFHKVVMLRNRLRVLEQKINASKLAEDEKLDLQSYITGCYGSLTSFNVLFADEADKFRGAGGGD
jgi:hypothetical protein